MISRVLCFMCYINLISVLQISGEEFDEISFNILNAGNAPFFELPCMAVGGTCARSVACPEGTKVETKGLCPVQQEHGMECCRPPRIIIKCKTRGGECVSDSFKCPSMLTLRDVTDCERKEICCAFSK